MKTAKQIRDDMQHTHTIELNTALELIESFIIEASNKGRTSTFFYDKNITKFHLDLREILKTLGYNVTYTSGSQIDTACLDISW